MKDKQHKVYSVTKSILSALYGIAIQKGYIKNENVPITDFFEDIEDAKKEITIKHLLMMSAGLRWPGNEAMIPAKNWVRFTLDQPVESKPGKVMKYSCGSSHLLSAILQRATGMDTVAFANKYLFTPLAIHNFNWHHDAQGVAIGGFSLTLKSEDMLKFGLLYLNKGEWNSKALIHYDWIRESTAIKMRTLDGPSYGFHWWILNDDSVETGKTYFARGMGGQYIIVNEDKRIVTVFTSNTQSDRTSPMEYFQNYILD
jgi:CubicO group peptidase (beta-lactamase class C family)